MNDATDEAQRCFFNRKRRTGAVPEMGAPKCKDQVLKTRVVEVIFHIKRLGPRGQDMSSRPKRDCQIPEIIARSIPVGRAFFDFPGESLEGQSRVPGVVVGLCHERRQQRSGEFIGARKKATTAPINYLCVEPAQVVPLAIERQVDNVAFLFTKSARNN